MAKVSISPFDPERYVGSITYVDPESIRVNLPYAFSVAGTQHAGHQVSKGQVGEFVFVEHEDVAIFGRIVETRLPDRERLSVEAAEQPRKEPPAPLGSVQLLATLSLQTSRAIKGIPQYPRIGERVFSAHPELVRLMILGDEGGASTQSTLQLATVPGYQGIRVSAIPDHIFGRHCAILGTTGGGKSWTVAKLIEEVLRLRGKAILFDPSGEFSSISHRSAEHVYLGGAPLGPEDRRRFASFPYTQLTDADLFSLFQPSGGVQAPKLREALKSLRLIKIVPALGVNGVLPKANRLKQPILNALTQHAIAINAWGANYDIQQLARQISEECVWPTAQNNPNAWGGASIQDAGYVASLLGRIEVIANSSQLQCLFNPVGLEPLTDVVRNFLNSSKRILRVSLESISFEHHARELFVNAIGRCLLGWARDGKFLKCPTVVFLDEAHQFLNKHIGDETNKVSLESFGLIAKEGRKYGLTCVLATQRPRDIPEDVLSQIGTFIVHRLIHDSDRKVVERACDNIGASAVKFLPTLGPGEAMLVGVDFPVPAPVLIDIPRQAPQSFGPNYKKHWK